MILWPEAVPIPQGFSQNSCDTRIGLAVRSSSFISNVGLHEDEKHIIRDKYRKLSTLQIRGCSPYWGRHEIERPARNLTGRFWK